MYLQPQQLFVDILILGKFPMVERTQLPKYHKLYFSLTVFSWSLERIATYPNSVIEMLVFFSAGVKAFIIPMYLWSIESTYITLLDLEYSFVC